MDYKISEKPVISALEIEGSIRNLGQQITSQFKVDLVLGVLTGSFIFVADLVRRLDPSVQIAFVNASSYGNAQKSTGCVEILPWNAIDFTHKNVLIVDDILDTGNTLSILSNRVREGGALEVKTCVLLDKPSRRQVQIHADFVGFSIEDYFAVGYGLDFASEYRALPAVYKTEKL